MAESRINTVITAKDEASSTLGKFGDNVSDLAPQFKKLGLAVAAVGAGVTLFAKSALDSTVQYTKSVKQLARETGETETETSRLINAGKRLGLTADDASRSFGLFSRKIADLRENSAKAGLEQQELNHKIEVTKAKISETNLEIKKNGDKTGDLRREVQGLTLDLKKYEQSLKETSNPLQKLGVATQNANGTNKTFREILFAVADKFKEMPNGIEKTAASMDLFGRSGKELIPLLNQGSAGIEELEKQADKLGLTLTSKNIDSVNKYIQAQKNLAASTDSLKLAVGLKAIPVMTEFNTKLNEVIISLINTKGRVGELSVGFLAFGGPVLGATGTIIAFGANLVQLWPALVTAAAKVAALNFQIFALGPTVTTATGLLGGFTAAMQTAILIAGTALVLTVAVGGIIYAIAKINEMKAAWNDAAKAEKNANDSYDRLVKNARAQFAAGKITKERLNALTSGRAMGGPVASGQPYIVGERGPELFVPKQSGQIVPNGGTVGGQNLTINISPNIGMYAGTPLERRKLAEQILSDLRDVASSRGVNLTALVAR